MLIIFILLLAVSPAWASGPVVKSSSGTYQGTLLSAMNGQTYKAFRGIPYAKPPLGDLRFQPPISPSYIDGVYDASDFKPYCIQMNVFPSQFNLGQEDCLYLNVFTPENIDRDKELKKIFVFFHGGGNMQGCPDFYLPGTLVTEHDVIVVTVAYRLGYLGLLSTKSPACEGNLHLKDQLLSLEWVKHNIKEFGGDPNGVTISGESAGGFDATLLAMVPGSRDLFARVYAQSGSTGVRYSALITNPRPHAIKLGRQLNCLRNDQPDPVLEKELKEMIDCLREIPALTFSMNGLTGEIPYLQPVFYGDLFPKSIEEMFLDEAYLKSIKFFDRDYLLGLDGNEGDLINLINDQLFSSLSEEVKAGLKPRDVLLNSFTMYLTHVFGPVSPEVVKNVVQYYEDHSEASSVADFFADAMFHIPTLQFAAAASGGRSLQDSQVFLFRFVHEPEWVLGKYKGMLHGFDIPYLFDIDLETVAKIIPIKLNTGRWSQDDDIMRQKFIQMVADFIKTGKPGRSLNDELPSGWPAFDKNGKQYLQLALKPEVKNNFIPKRVTLWEEQIPKWISEFPFGQERHEEL